MEWSMYVRASDLQFIATLIPFLRILKTRRTSAFSMDSQLLFIIGFTFKYMHYPISSMSIPDDINTTYTLQFWMRLILVILMLMTFFVSVNISRYFETETDRYWLYGGTITSFVLAADFSEYNRSRYTTIVCTFGAYLDVVSWVPQFKLTLKNMRVDQWLLFYIIFSFTYEFINMGGMDQDYYHKFVGTDFRLKMCLIKFFLFCGFLVKYFRRQLIIRIGSLNEIPCESNLNEVILVSSAEEYSDKMLFRTLGMENVLVNRRLMSPC